MGARLTKRERGEFIHISADESMLYVAVQTRFTEGTRYGLV